MPAVGGSSIHRNVPDVAMCADDIELVYTTTTPGVVTVVGGTSAAAPLWAGFTALVNEQAKSLGKPYVGFLNPALYEIAAGPSYSSCFHDITVGNNTNAASPNLFFAAPGYDLCTGLGSPNGANLLNALVTYSGDIFVQFNYTASPRYGTYFQPFNTLATGVNTVVTNGTIFIKDGGSSSETMTISKPMIITAIGGAATVGN
jgi:subtilase family serine protease